MACFIAPVAEAVVVTAVNKLSSKKMDKNINVNELHNDSKISFHKKVKWLEDMLWGGSALLAFEHVWHGEVVPWFPFLTAAENSADLSAMIRELSTTGVGMAVLVTVVWGIMLLASDMIEKHGSFMSKAVK